RWAERRASNSSASYLTGASSVTQKLALSDKWQAGQVRNISACQSQQMDTIYATNELQTAEMNKAGLDEAEKAKRATQIGADSKKAVNRQGDRCFEKLALLLEDEQSELVKNEMTDQGFPKELARFEELLPALTDEHKAAIVAYLKEGRENALNVLMKRERNQWFAKYRGRANNYLSKQGYDLRKATEELERR